MHIVRHIEEFISYVSQPNPGEVYGLVPLDYRVLDMKPILEVFTRHTNCLVYTDILEVNNGLRLLRFNPSFNTYLVMSGFVFNSPIFVKSERPLIVTTQSLHELTTQILQQIIGIHIPEPIIQWNRSLDLVKEISTV